MISNELDTPTEDISTYVKIAEEFMGLLLETGFTVQSVLERGFEYMMSYSFSLDRAPNLLFAAKVVNETAQNLHIDRESQRQAVRDIQWRGRI